MSNMVELYVDVDNEFYIMWDDDEDSYVLTNLVTDSEQAISQGEFLDLRDNMRHYSIHEEHVQNVLDGAVRAILPDLPDYYKPETWDNYHGD